VRRAIKAAARAGAIASLVAALPACSDFERIDFGFESTPPVDVVLTYEQIRIPEGVAVFTTASPMASDGLMATDTEVQFNAADPSVLGVALALPENLDGGTSRDLWSFVFFGAGVGETTVTVRINGSVEGEIPASVEAQ
jgi:hypothetical protein